jgi:twinkle protein
MLISRYGVNGLVIDPWTEIDKGGKSGTEDINELLSNMNQFKRDRNCHIFLVAHPTKMPKDPSTGLIEVPDLMNISGSANFFNKTDMGLTVYRDMKNDTVWIHINKVKFKHLGKIASIEMIYNVQSGRYQDANDDWDDSNWLAEDKQLDAFEKSAPEPLVEEFNGFRDTEFDGSGLDLPF